MSYVIGFKDKKGSKKFIDFDNLYDALMFIKSIKNDVLSYAMLQVERG